MESTTKRLLAGTASVPTQGRANTQPLEVANLPNALLRLPTAAVFAGLSEASLYRLAAKDPTFPKLVKIGKRCTRIRAGDLTAWLAKQAGA